MLARLLTLGLAGNGVGGLTPIGGPSGGVPWCVVAVCDVPVAEDPDGPDPDGGCIVAICACE